MGCAKQTRLRQRVRHLHRGLLAQKAELGHQLDVVRRNARRRQRLVLAQHVLVVALEHRHSLHQLSRVEDVVQTALEHRRVVRERYFLPLHSFVGRL